MGKDLKGKELGKGITQRKNGLYYGRAMINGIEVSASSVKLSKCKEQLKLKKNEVISGLVMGLDVRKSKEVTLNKWFDEWFKIYKIPNIKESSIAPLKTKYRTTFGKIIGDKKLKEITNLDIQRALNSMHASNLSTSTIREGLGILRSCLEVAKNNSIILGNPSIGIQVPWKSAKKSYRVLTIEEQRTFLKFCEDNWYKEMFYVMFGTGMRIGELGGLKWEDIDWIKKTITIRRALMTQYDTGVKTMKLTTPKTVNSYRDIPFFPLVEENLLSQKEKQEKRIKEFGKRRWRQEGELSNFVFTTSVGSPVTRYVAQKEINKIVNDINRAEALLSKEEGRWPIEFQKLFPHAIRHTFCTRLFEAKMDFKVIQKLMGHSHLSTTMDIYTHITEEKMISELKNLDNIIKV